MVHFKIETDPEQFQGPFDFLEPFETVDRLNP